MSREVAPQFHNQGIYWPSRTVYLGGDEVNHKLSDQVVKNLHMLDRAFSDKGITLMINNPGGEEAHMLAIYDAIKACRNHVTGIIYGEACSAASVIVQACDTRIMRPHSYMMIHYGTSDPGSDHPKIIRAWVKWYDECDRLMEDIFLERIKEKHPEYTRKRVQHLLNFDTILWSNDVVELGLADKVE